MSSQNVEIAEAIDAANHALEHLYAADKLLGSAGNWGLFDMLGGGGFISLVKHGKMAKAERELNAARRALEIFTRELQDVDGHSGGVHIKTDGFASFLDVFCDNVFADLMVQDRISNAQQQVAVAIRQVETVRDQLSRR